MNQVSLTAIDLVIASTLVLLLALLSFRMKLRLEKQILIAAFRTLVQLLMVGFALKALFANANPLWIILASLFMLLVAGREVTARQRRRFKGWARFGVGTFAMFCSSFTVTVLALTVIIDFEPWYAPRYAIPLLGMLLGNTMTGIALGMDRLTQATWEQRDILEQRLMLGQSRQQVIREICGDSIRSGLIPVVNSMAVAGIVSLPGMMTGQILAGIPPFEAVKYQILIMFLITAGTGFGTMFAVWWASGNLFDKRHRLRLDHLQERVGD